MTIRSRFAPAIILLALAAVTNADSIWVEGENATVKQITPHPWYNSVKKEVLSGGAWAGHFNRDKPGLLEIADGSDHPNDVAIAKILRKEIREKLRDSDGP